MQMAWISREEEALDRVREHLGESNQYVRMEFFEAVTRAVFPRLGVTGAQTRWITRGDVTQITLWGRQHLEQSASRLSGKQWGLGQSIIVS